LERFYERIECVNTYFHLIQITHMIKLKRLLLQFTKNNIISILETKSRITMHIKLSLLVILINTTLDCETISYSISIVMRTIYSNNVITYKHQRHKMSNRL